MNKIIFNNDVLSIVFGSFETHEVAVAPLVPTSSVGKYTFTGKSIRFAQSLRAINDFPKSANADFCKLHINRNKLGCKTSERLIQVA